MNALPSGSDFAASSPLSNSMTLDEVLALARTTGEKEGEGGSLKHELMYTLGRAVVNEVISPDSRSGDVEAFARAYFGGKQGMTYAPGSKDFNKGTWTKTLSQFRTIATVAGFGQAYLDMLERALPITKAARAAGVNRSTYDLLISVGVAQKRTPGEPLTDEEIETAVNPDKGEKPYSLTASINDILKRIYTAVDGTDDAPDGKPGKPMAKSIAPKTEKIMNDAVDKLKIALKLAAEAEGVELKQA